MDSLAASGLRSPKVGRPSGTSRVLLWFGQVAKTSTGRIWKNLEDGVELMSSDINQSDGHVQALTDRTGWNRMEPHDMK